MQGPYPVSSSSAQPNLSLVFPTPETGARDQSLRLSVKPELWGASTRFRFSNALGTQPLTFDGVADFDLATTDIQTGAMKAEFFPDNTIGGPGDKLHPNRISYPAMGMTIDLSLFGTHGHCSSAANVNAAVVCQ